MLVRLIDLPHIGFCTLPYTYAHGLFFFLFIHTYTPTTTFPSLMLSLVFHSLLHLDLVVTFIDWSSDGFFAYIVLSKLWLLLILNSLIHDFGYVWLVLVLIVTLWIDDLIFYSAGITWWKVVEDLIVHLYSVEQNFNCFCLPSIAELLF